ncbi:MAG: hypothetical protein E7812_00030 [Phenylobacterium sp.]|nr:MAG: hypothetical protein E7812_00030 [Phenylobacterium sp.]
MVADPDELVFRQSRSKFFGYVAGSIAMAAGLALKGHSSGNPYTAVAFYVFAVVLLGIGGRLLPWMIWPDTLRLTRESLVWQSPSRRKIVLSARWSDLEAVGVCRPRPISVGFGVSQDRPIQIGLRFKGGRLPADLKAKGAGALDLGDWSWAIPNLWNSHPAEIVAACEEHLRGYRS